jgi:hypothetical protein
LQQWRPDPEAQALYGLLEQAARDLDGVEEN